MAFLTFLFVILNICIALGVAWSCRKAPRRGCSSTQHRLAWIMPAFVLTRLGIILPPYAPENCDVSVLAAVLVDTCLLLVLWAWCWATCRLASGSGIHKAVPPSTLPVTR